MKIRIFTIISMLLALSSCNKSETRKVEAALQPPRHVRVIWTENPAQEAIISWTTLGAIGASHTIHFDTVSTNENSDYAWTVPSMRDGKITMLEMDYTEGVPEGFYHHGQLKGLKPDTKYYFSVSSDGKFSQEYYFKTAPAEEKNIAIIWGGDSRLGGEKPRYAGRTPHVDRQKMNEVIRKIAEKDTSVIAFAHGADYCSTAEWRHLYWWFEDHENVKTSDNRLLPLIISRGNHDYAVGFQENFWLGNISDENSHAYYYHTKLTPAATLITLNTEISVAGAQRDWLEKSLQELRPTNKWLLAHYHRPAYPVVKDFDNQTFARVRKAWTPLFETYNIDLALESDGHILKRTVPIRNEKYSPDGIIYIGEGGLGVPQRTADTTRWFIQPPGFAKTAHNVHKLNFGTEMLQVTAFGINFDTLDHFSLASKQSMELPQQVVNDEDEH